MSNKKYIDETSKTFKRKSKEIQQLINTTLYILECLGVPLKETPRRLERKAIVFLAICNVKTVDEWNKVKDLDSGYTLKTRQIIEYVNTNFGENISSGSYDDIRRKDLKILVAGNIVLQSSPNSATNDSTRGYGLNPFYAKLIRQYNKSN